MSTIVPDDWSDAMNNYWLPLRATALAIGIALAIPAAAKDEITTKTVGAYRIELHLLPAEPFYTADEVAAKHVTIGMLIQGGAAPVPPNADSHPNHHLVVHVFDRKTGKAITDAKVSLNFEPLEHSKLSAAASVEVPVVIMQAIGSGPKSTHYGNNVTMPAGSYRVTATVNDAKAVFQVRASDTPANSGGPMPGMKM
jgi:hypothetical protein